MEIAGELSANVRSNGVVGQIWLVSGKMPHLHSATPLAGNHRNKPGWRVTFSLRRARHKQVDRGREAGLTRSDRGAIRDLVQKCLSEKGQCFECVVNFCFKALLFSACGSIFGCYCSSRRRSFQHRLHPQQQPLPRHHRSHHSPRSGWHLLHHHL